MATISAFDISLMLWPIDIIIQSYRKNIKNFSCSGHQDSSTKILDFLLLESKIIKFSLYVYLCLQI